MGIPRSDPGRAIWPLSEKHLLYRIGGVGIREISQRRSIYELEGSPLATGDAAVGLTDSHGIGRIDGGRVDGFFGQKVLFDTG